MNDQISFLPMLEPRDTSFEDNERKASQICDEEFERADGDIVKYVAACVDRFNKELPFHNAYLRLTGYNEQEYREKLKQDSPTVYAARVAAGIYQEA